MRHGTVLLHHHTTRHQRMGGILIAVSNVLYKMLLLTASVGYGTILGGAVDWHRLAP